VPLLRAMPNRKNVNIFARHAIDNHVRPNRRKLARAAPRPRPSALGENLKSVTGSDKFNGHARGGAGIVACYVCPDIGKVTQCATGEIYGHLGGGNSLSLPHDSSQRRIFS
jgi:hypothetical protein